MSQHAYAQHQNQQLKTVSLPQPGHRLARQAVGIEAGKAALVLAALCLSATLWYAVASARCTKNGYATQVLARTLGDLQAQNELLRYQINLSQSSYQVEQVAAGLAMHPAQAAEVDYVVLPHSEHRVTLAELDPGAGGLRGALRSFAKEVGRPATGRAEASTSVSHRP